jgi:hypothetical protein
MNDDTGETRAINGGRCGALVVPVDRTGKSSDHWYALRYTSQLLEDGTPKLGVKTTVIRWNQQVLNLVRQWKVRGLSLFRQHEDGILIGYGHEHVPVSKVAIYLVCHVCTHTCGFSDIDCARSGNPTHFQPFLVMNTHTHTHTHQ